MAKKRRGRTPPRKTVASVDNEDDDEQWEDVEEENMPAPREIAPAAGPGTPRIMVTWNGPGGETRPEPKQWHGIAFEQGKPTPVEHLPPQVWDSMRRDIDAGSGWSYEYVVEHPEPPPATEPPPEE